VSRRGCGQPLAASLRHTASRSTASRHTASRRTASRRTASRSTASRSTGCQPVPMSVASRSGLPMPIAGRSSRPSRPRLTACPLRFAIVASLAPIARLPGTGSPSLPCLVAPLLVAPPLVAQVVNLCPCSASRSGLPMPIAGRSLRASRPSLSRRRLRSAIHGFAGRLRRLPGTGSPSLPLLVAQRLCWSSTCVPFRFASRSSIDGTGVGSRQRASRCHQEMPIR